ncbi:hypothetical protein SCACP_34570 [Sporomusa carbonis]|uniref:4Fe-4S binding protein n=1 Tax=Sporomusa carbonis TaxID=3076075 RepID=UPI003A73B6EE
MPLVDDFSKLFDAPGFIKPYLHFFATKQEMRLAATLGKESLTARELAGLLAQPEEEIESCLEQAYLRHIIDKDSENDTIRYRAGNFYSRLRNFCLFGNYHIIPPRIRKKLDEWDFAEYLKRNDYFKAVHDASPEYDQCHNEWILLVSEVEAMIDAATAIRVLPCDCKMLAENCDHSREICLVLDKNRVTDRTGGRELTKDEAKKLIRELDQEGLMHTGGPPNWQETGPAVVCNCCACCCYPFRAAIQLGTKGKWPRSRYVAVYDKEKCLQCGLCAKRCYFAAFHFAGMDGNEMKQMAFDPKLCWGCGICVSTCPSQAIRLVKISGGEMA